MSRFSASGWTAQKASTTSLFITRIQVVPPAGQGHKHSTLFPDWEQVIPSMFPIWEQVLSAHAPLRDSPVRILPTPCLVHRALEENKDTLRFAPGAGGPNSPGRRLSWPVRPGKMEDRKFVSPLPA